MLRFTFKNSKVSCCFLRNFTTVHPGILESDLKTKSALLDTNHTIAELKSDSYYSNSKKLIVVFTHKPRSNCDSIKLSNYDFQGEKIDQYAEFHEIKKNVRVIHTAIDSDVNRYIDDKKIMYTIDQKAQNYHGNAYDNDD